MKTKNALKAVNTFYKSSKTNNLAQLNVVESDAQQENYKEDINKVLRSALIDNY